MLSFTLDDSRSPTICFSLGTILLYFLLFLMKIIERLNEFLSEKGFILIKSVSLTAKSCTFNILNFKLDHFARHGRNIDIKIGLHL